MIDREQCHHLLEFLSDYVDGSVNQEICREIERHMEGCENCRIVIDTLRKTIYLYHETAVTEPQVPDDVRQRLYRRLKLDDLLSH